MKRDVKTFDKVIIPAWKIDTCKDYTGTVTRAHGNGWATVRLDEKDRELARSPGSVTMETSKLKVIGYETW